MKPYEPPTYQQIGSLRELTLGASTGTRLDATFTTGSTLDHLTFSG